MPTPLEQVATAIEQAKEEGIQIGLQRAQQQFYGTAAAVLPLALFADAALSIGQRIREYNPAVGQFFAQQARLYASLATPPRVVSTVPLADYTVSAPDAVSATFENAVDPGTITADNVFLMADSGGPHLSSEVRWGAASKTVTVVPTNPLNPGTTYRLVVKQAVANQAGMQMGQDYVARFAVAS